MGGKQLTHGGGVELKEACREARLDRKQLRKPVGLVTSAAVGPERPADVCGPDHETIGEGRQSHRGFPCRV